MKYNLCEENFIKKELLDLRKHEKYVKVIMYMHDVRKRSNDMRKLKDFFYDKNDIIIVLLIVAAAAFIIYNRIDAIMDYPETYAKEAAETATKTKTVEETDQQTQASESTAPESSASSPVSITIDDADTSSSVATKLQEAGLIEDTGAFETYVNSAGKASSIRSGTFQIPKGSSSEEILNIITQ